MLPQDHPRLRVLDPLVLALDVTASAAARKIKKAGRSRSRKRGQSLQPGADTPLWNELSTECGAYLVRHGDKARLGRVLGLSRQRVHQLLVERSACPDAERTLQLMLWLARQRRGKETL